jgi:putative membrane protein
MNKLAMGTLAVMVLGQAAFGADNTTGSDKSGATGATGSNRTTMPGAPQGAQAHTGAQPGGQADAHAGMPGMPMKVTAADFVAKASEAGTAEVELGKLASQKGTSPAVREFGQRMVTDHTKANSELEGIATKKSLTPNKMVNAEHKKAMEDLHGKSGKEFDAAYAAQMVKDHNEAVALFTAASSLSDPELAGFASKTLPTLRDHQSMAKQLPAH